MHMKTLIILAATAALTASGIAKGDNLSAPTVPRRTVQPQPGPANEGAIQRAARIGNPLQLTNPFAPTEYGSGRAFVTNSNATEVTRPQSHARPIGLRLFSITF